MANFRDIYNAIESGVHAVGDAGRKVSDSAPRVNLPDKLFPSPPKVGKFAKRVTVGALKGLDVAYKGLDFIPSGLSSVGLYNSNWRNDMWNPFDTLSNIWGNIGRGYDNAFNFFPQLDVWDGVGRAFGALLNPGDPRDIWDPFGGVTERGNRAVEIFSEGAIGVFHDDSQLDPKVFVDWVGETYRKYTDTPSPRGRSDVDKRYAEERYVEPWKFQKRYDLETKECYWIDRLGKRIKMEC